MTLNTTANVDAIATALAMPCTTAQYSLISTRLAAIDAASATIAAEQQIVQLLTDISTTLSHLRVDTTIPHLASFHANVVHLNNLISELEARLGLTATKRIFDPSILLPLATVTSAVTTPKVTLPTEQYLLQLQEPIVSATVPVLAADGQLWEDISVSPTRVWVKEGAYWVGHTTYGANANRFAVNLSFSQAVTNSASVQQFWVSMKDLSTLPSGVVGAWIGKATLTELYYNSLASASLAGTTAYIGLGVANTGLTDGVTGSRLAVDGANSLLIPGDQSSPAIVPLAVTQTVIVSNPANVTTTANTPITTRQGQALWKAAQDMTFATDPTQSYGFFDLTAINITCTKLALNLRAIAGASTAVTATGTINVQPNGGISSINLTNTGSGYTSAPTISFTGGSGGIGQATLDPLGAVSIARVRSGSGYTSNPTLTWTPVGGGSVTSWTVTLDGDAVGSISVNSQSTTITSCTVAISGGGGSGATAYVSCSGGFVQQVIMTSGTGYTGGTAATFSAPPSSAANLQLSGSVSADVGYILPAVG